MSWPAAVDEAQTRRYVCSIATVAASIDCRTWWSVLPPPAHSETALRITIDISASSSVYR